MATYLPNVNKYVSKTEAFTPDFKFLSDALGRRQDRYDTNYRKMNNLYGSVVHADLSREDNRRIRDTYAEELAPKLQQISGVDFSLQQNVQSAKALFTPFFEDEKIVRDIVFTKRFKTEQQRFQGWRGSEDEEIRKKYWDGGVQALNYSMADFQKFSREESMNVQLPEAVEHVNLVQVGIDALKELGMDVTDVSFSKDGNYKITQKNGVALTRRQVGVDPVTGDPIYTNPAQNFLLQTTLDDPRVQRFYQTEFYVKARQFYEENAEKYGGEEAAEKVFYEQMISDYSIKHAEEEPKKEAEHTSALEAKNNWEAYKEKYGNPVIGSEEHKKYAQAYNEYIAVANGRKLYNKSHDLISTESKSLDDLKMKATKAYMQYNIDADTREAAKFYADVNSERTIEADKFALQNHKHRLDQVMEEQKAANKRMQTMFEKGYVMDENGNMLPMPWAETGGNNTSTNQQQIFGTTGGQDAVPGSGEETSSVYKNEDGIVNIIADNAAISEQKISQIRDLRWNSIEKYYQVKAEDIGDDDNVYSAEGMKIDGVFMTWAEAKEYFIKPENKAKFKEEYDKIEAIYRDETTGPSLQKDNPALYNQIHRNVMQIEGESIKLFSGWKKQREVYRDVVNLLSADGTLNSYQLKLLDAYPLINSRGKMLNPDTIVGEMKSDFANWFNQSGLGDSRPSVTEEHEEIAEQFGFKDGEDLLDNIYSSGKRTNDINSVSKEHFSNMYDEWVGKDDAQSLYTEVINAMNKKMQTAEAIPGIQTFNMGSYLTNQEQGGSGGMIYNYYDSDYVSGQVNVKANTQLALINLMMKNSPKQDYTILLGDRSDSYSAVSDPAAEAVLKEIFGNLKRDPDSFTKGTEPNFTIRWAENMGGEAGGGKHSGWVITLREGYASTIKSSHATVNNNLVLGSQLKNNSITVFTSEEYGQSNPNSVKNTYVGITEWLVDMNKTRVIDNDGGRIVFWRNSDGQMLVKERVGTYDRNVNGGSIVYSPYTEPRILPPSGYAIDQIFNEYDARANARIKINTDASNAHKAEQDNTNNSQ